MRYHLPMKAPRGMTLIDVLVGTALMLIIFLALFGLLRASLLVSSAAKLKAGATTVATSQLEYLRSLPYDSLGTAGGIPSGTIPQNASTTLNTVTYGIRTFIEYVDDAKDGTGASDTNHIMTDYKRAKVAVTYAFRGTTREVALVSNIAPPSLETTTGGGTLRISVVNAVGSPVAGASVRIQNPSLSPAVDLVTFSDATGIVALPGAPVSTDYRITVSKTGYSTAQTYARDATNQNPTPAYLTVAANQTTTSTFAVDSLASLTVKTFSPVRAASSTDLFANAASLASQSGTQVTGSALALASDASGYSLSGTAQSTTTAPAYIWKWKTVSATRTLPAGTSVKLHVADGTGILLPDTVLSGNAAGFSALPISLAGISTSTYPALRIKADLATAATTASPSVLDWTIAFDEGPLPLPNVPLTLTGAKRKGTTGTGAAIYKTVVATTTDAAGTRTLPLEWDVYGVGFTGYALVSSSTTPPYTLAPASSLESWLVVQ